MWHRSNLMLMACATLCASIGAATADDLVLSYVPPPPVDMTTSGSALLHAVENAVSALAVASDRVAPGVARSIAATVLDGALTFRLGPEEALVYQATSELVLHVGFDDAGNTIVRGGTAEAVALHMGIVLSEDPVENLSVVYPAILLPRLFAAHENLGTELRNFLPEIAPVPDPLFGAETLAALVQGAAMRVLAEDFSCANAFAEPADDLARLTFEGTPELSDVGRFRIRAVAESDGGYAAFVSDDAFGALQIVAVLDDECRLTGAVPLYFPRGSRR
jgi:hypothetical protein